MRLTEEKRKEEEEDREEVDDEKEEEVEEEELGKIEPCNTRLNFNIIKHAISTTWRMVH